MRHRSSFDGRDVYDAVDLARVEGLGGKFRNEMIEGPGGKQILLVDPSGNFVELFEQAWG